MKRLAQLCAASLLALGALSACSSPEERAAEYTKRANQLLADGEYEKAGVEARNAVQIQPKNTAARWVLVQVAEQKREYAAMLENLALVVEEDAGNAQARIKLGTLMVFAQDYNGASMLAADAMKLAPDDPGAHLLQARVLLQKQDMDGVMKSIDRVIELDPGNLDAAALRAAALSMTDPQKAIADLEVSIARVGADKAEPLRQLRVDLLARVGRNDEVEKELRTMLAEFGGAKYSDNLALFYSSQNRLDEAEQVLRDAVAARPDEVGAKVKLAQFQSRFRKQPAEAERTLKAFVEQTPDNQELQAYLASFYEGTGRTEEAVAAYRKVADLDAKTIWGLQARNRIASLQLKAGQIEAASKALGEILEDEPDNVAALLSRGEINYAAGRNDDAIADFRGVLRREPDNQVALLLMAKTHLAVGDQPLAEDAYRRVLQVNPKNVEALAALAGLLGGSGQLEEAEDLLKQAVAIDARQPEALEALVGVYLAKRDLEAAEATARDLIAALPERDLGQRELGRVLEAKGDAVGAIAAYKSALALKPDSTLALEGIARGLQSTGKLAEATDFLQQHLEEYPDHVLARVLLGGNQLRRGQLEAARATLEQAVDQQPSLVRAWLVLGGAYPDDPAKRLDVLGRGRQANPKAAVLAVLLASEHQRAGKVDEAIKVYEEAIEDAPRDVAVVNNLAALLLDNRTDEASYKRALDLASRFANSKQPMYLDTLGWAHYRNKDYDAAIRFLELAVAFGSKEPIARYHLGMAYLATDNTEGARQELEKSIQDVNPAAPWVAPARKTLQSLAAKPAAKGNGAG